MLWWAGAVSQAPWVPFERTLPGRRVLPPSCVYLKHPERFSLGLCAQPAGARENYGVSAAQRCCVCAGRVPSLSGSMRPHVLLTAACRGGCPWCQAVPLAHAPTCYPGVTGKGVPQGTEQAGAGGMSLCLAQLCALDDAVGSLPSGICPSSSCSSQSWQPHGVWSWAGGVLRAVRISSAPHGDPQEVASSSWAPMVAAASTGCTHPLLPWCSAPALVPVAACTESQSQTWGWQGPLQVASSPSPA